MKLNFLILEGKAPAWVESARREYQAKISPFIKFEITSLKSPSADRDSLEVKRRLEGALILKQLSPKDMLILFDEHGKLAKTSEAFASTVAQVLESGKQQVVLCIGGPYGFAEEVKKRAQSTWSLSPLTMNHWLAQLVALEQVYRAFTISKGIPYHNR